MAEIDVARAPPGRSLGIPRRKIYGLVIAQSWWVGVFGVMTSVPVVWLLAQAAAAGGAKVVLRWEVMGGAALVTISTALFSGLFALRSVRKIEPISLLR